VLIFISKLQVIVFLSREKAFGTFSQNIIFSILALESFVKTILASTISDEAINHPFTSVNVFSTFIHVHSPYSVLKKYKLGFSSVISCSQERIHS